MKLFPATIPPEEIEATAVSMETEWAQGRDEVLKAFPAPNLKEAGIIIRAYLKEEAQNPLWKNETYQVKLRGPNAAGWQCLSIKRVDREPIHDWRDLQEIKNIIWGPGVEAVELYPCEARRVDSANQYFLWSNPKHLPQFPFGFNEGRVVTERSIYKSRNRPL